LISQLAALGREIIVLAVTDGTASHAGSPAWPPERLAQVRPAETLEALRRLRAGKLRIMRAGLPDGRVAEHEATLDALLCACLWPTDVVFATWRHDGHPDHEAVGRAAARAARRRGAILVEVPVWTWHWAEPDDGRVPWNRARRVVLDAGAQARKAAAVDAFASQILPDQSARADAVLPPSTLSRLLRQFEVFLV
jgi:LmbE family N-acetylglucosaminyl deacetylase